MRVFPGLLVGLLVLLSGYLFYREHQFISSEKINAWTEEQSADCGVVVTGGPGRVREGIDLLYQKKIKKLIISGVHPGATFKEIFPQWPYYHGLNNRDIVLERYSRTTFGNARQSLPLVEALRCQSVLLITSRQHMYRTKRTFFATYPEDIEISTRSVGEGEFEFVTWWTVVEVLKSLFYSTWAY